MDEIVPGSYMVTYNVNDDGGNPAVEVTRTVNVISYGEEISDLMDLVDPITDQKNVENALLGTLKQTGKMIDDSNPDNDSAACDKLADFIYNVNDKAYSGKLSSDDSDLLVKEAQ